jgi:hypothetical protein
MAAPLRTPRRRGLLFAQAFFGLRFVVALPGPARGMMA